MSDSSQAQTQDSTQSGQPTEAQSATPQIQVTAPPAATQQPVSQPSAPSTQHGQTVGQELLNAVNALPEKIANTLREALPKPGALSQQSSTASDASKTEGSQSTSSTQKKDNTSGSSTTNAPQGANKSFGDKFRQWWGG
jgi:hypothetical protein